MRVSSALPSAIEPFPGDDPTSVAHRSHDWAASPLGPVEGWPDDLRAAIRTVLPSRIPMLLWWGPELVQVYNDPFSDLMGDKHPGGVGQPAAECWSEAWADLTPFVASAWSGVATLSHDLPLLLRRHGFAEETTWTFSYSPITDAAGEVCGLFVATTDTTQVGVRGVRLTVLGRLGAMARSSATSVEDVVAGAVRVLADCPGDVRFAVARLRAGVDGPLVPVATLGLAADQPVDADDGPGDPDLLARVLRDRTPQREDAPPGGWPSRPTAPAGRERTRCVLHLPIVDAGTDRAIGTLSVGLNPHRTDDEGYRSFLGLVAHHVSTAVTDALALATEQRRVEALADLDRAKTRFLQTVSHELRTPLALIAGSHRVLLDEVGLDGRQRGDVEIAQRATQRLHALVDGLLDVARAEEGRLEARVVPTDLGALTTEVAGMFRSAVEEAGLTLDLRVADLPGAVELDPEMWSRIVSNLVGNAHKFTAEGTITVELAADADTIALVVSDTGAGIPEEELPHLFERFHQVAGTPGRTSEGAGIGLALVRDLAATLGGEVTVESTVGSGSRFTVTIPHRPSAEPTAGASAAAVDQASPLAAEAAGWTTTSGLSVDEDAAPDDDRILVVEDNADMRDHVVRILRQDGWAVDAVGDVPSALARPTAPLLVVSDVMLPGLDGIDLVQALRADADRSDVPVVLLTARAGPEAAAEGIAAGATDYLVKPFDPAELQARVRSHAELHRRRRDALAEVGDRADHLELALRSSRRIGAAIGIIMDRTRTTEDEAFARLRKASQDRNRKLREVADEIVRTGTVPDL